MSKAQNLYSEKCFSEEVIDENCFVGIHFKDGNFDIKYPLGYRISEDEKENKKDGCIRLLCRNYSLNCHQFLC